MAQGAEDAHHPDLLPAHVGLEQAHDEPAQHPAGQTVQHAHDIADDEIAQDDPHHENGASLPAAQGPDGKEGNYVGDAQLHAGDGDGEGDLGLNEKDDHGDGREHGHGGEFSDIHYDTPSSWDDVPLSMTWMTRRLGRQAMGEAVWSVGPVRTQTWSGQLASETRTLPSAMTTILYPPS